MPNTNANSLLIGLASLVLASFNTVSGFAEDASSDFLGAWAFDLPDGNPAWLKLSSDGANVNGSLLWSVGSARPVKSIRIENGILTFARNISWRPYGDPTAKTITTPFQGTLVDDTLRLRFTQADATDASNREEVIIDGIRIPPPPPRPDLSRIKFGETIQLFDGHSLEGWKLSNPNKKNGWRAENGCLVNETPKLDFGAYGQFGNLMTERLFDDFELTIEYSVPPKGNSGIYLRGMYEAQVVDRDSRMQGIQGPGAIFGRLKPVQNAGKEGDDWNTYVLTLCNRHVTVKLNGQTVIDNELLEGCTGGGIQANDEIAGPILLQGDHTSVKYRNIRLRPVVTNESKGECECSSHR